MDTDYLSEYYRDRDRYHSCESTRYKDELEFYVSGRFDCELKSCSNISNDSKMTMKLEEYNSPKVQKNLKYILL